MKMKITLLFLFLIPFINLFCQRDTVYVIDENEKVSLKSIKVDSVYNLSIYYCQKIPEYILNFKNLHYLEFENSSFDNIPEFLYNLKTLEGLTITNHKNCDANTELLKQICRLSQLKQLEVYGIRVGTFPDEIRNLQQLESLSIHFCDLTSLPAGLYSLKNLKKLEVNCNKLNNIPTDIKNLSNLQELDISHNEFTKIPLSIFELNNLRILSLRGLRCPIPPDIEKLTNLRELDIRMNNYKEIPQSLYRLDSIKVLDFRDNLPDSLISQVKDTLKCSFTVVLEDTLLMLPDSIMVGREAHAIGDTVGFFDRFDFNKGEWKMILFAETAYYNSKYKRKNKQIDKNYEDELTYGFVNKNLQKYCAVLDDMTAMKDAKKNLKVVITGGDMTTAYLMLYLICDDKIVYSTGLFAYENGGGFQSDIGWTPCIKDGLLTTFLEKFYSSNSSTLIKYGIVKRKNTSEE